MSFFEFPHSRTYDSDLGWLMAKYPEIAENAAKAAASEEAAKASEEAAAASAASAIASADEATDARDYVVNAIRETTEELNARLSQAISGATPTDTELQDVRVWADAETSLTAGDAVRGQMNMIGSNLDLLSEDLSGITYSDGYYTNTGNFVSGTSGGFQYSSVDIPIRKGQVLVFRAKGYSTNASMIGAVRAGTTAVTPLVTSIDSDYHDYSYMADEDKALRICYQKNTLKYIRMYTNADAIANAADVTRLGNYVGRQNTITWTDGYFLAADDSLHESNVYSYSDYIDVRNLGNLIVSTYINDYAGIVLYDAQKTRIAGYRNNTDMALPYFRRIVRSEVPTLAYIRITCRTADKDKYMIVKEPATSIINTQTYNYTATNIPAWAKDADNLYSGSFFAIRFGWNENTGMVHYPFTNYQGTILTYKGDPTGDLGAWGFQLAIYEGIENYARMWMRVRYNSWTEWKAVGDEGAADILAADGLGDFVVCGDSLSVSLAYRDSTASPATVKSWARIMADSIHSECAVYAQGGIATGGYISSSLYTNAVADTSQFAVIYLGTNDANNSVDATTFRNNYETIVNGLLQNHKFVFCMNLPECTSPSNRATYNQIISEVCGANNKAFLVDVASYNNAFAPFLSWGHLSSVGYGAFANAAEAAITDTMKRNAFFANSIDF